MKHARIIWLLLLVLFQPSFTRAACNVSKLFEERIIPYVNVWGDYNERTETVSYYDVQCTLTNLHAGVPLSTYMSGSYASEATNARIIDFSSSTISTVPVGVLHAFNQVEILRMNNISLNSITPGALSGMTQLQELDLNDNNITEIQDGTFDGLVQLKKLYMVGNKLTKLKSLNGLTNLEQLDLDVNNIEAIDDGAFKDTVRLKYLYLNGNRLVNLSATLFSTMSQLSIVSLANNLINNISTGLFNTTQLLNYLHLHNNAIQSVACSELSGKVRLASNQITSLANCSKKILYFDVSYNNLTSLPAMLFDQPTSLTYLYLDYNTISRIHADAFVELRNLTTLTLNNNRITNIPLGTFRHLTQVTELNISSNNLSYFKFGIFSGLASLKILDVSNNKIAMLKSKVLFPLKSLTQLKLDGNLLQSFDADTMASHWTTLESISLDRNQIQCEWLATCIHVFAIRNITVVSGHSFKTDNVHGIYCVGDNEQQSTIIPTAVSAKVTELLSPTTKQLTTARKPLVPTVAVVPTQVTPSSTKREPSTTVFYFTKADELVDVSTENAVHPQDMEEHGQHAPVGDKRTEAFRAEDENINDHYVELVKANSNTHSLLVFVIAAVIILIIINLAFSLFIMYSIKRINMENTRKSLSSCAVELLNVTD